MECPPHQGRFFLEWARTPPSSLQGRSNVRAYGRLMDSARLTDHTDLAPVAALSSWQRQKLSTLERSSEPVHLHGCDGTGTVHFATAPRFTETGSLVWPRYGTVSADGRLDWHVMAPTVA